MTGETAVRKSFKEGASHFLPQSTSTLEILDSASDGDLGFWTWVQHAKVKVKGKDAPVSVAAPCDNIRTGSLARRLT